MERHCDAENPFSTRRVRPGAIPFIFPPGENAEMLVDRLRKAEWRGQIIGPHGSGKSCLLSTLTEAIERTGRRTVLVVLHDGQRKLPADPLRQALGCAPAVLVVDGYEQLRCWRRFALRQFCRRHRLGLLVTAHGTVGLPMVYQTVVTPEVAERVVGVLLGTRDPVFTSDEVSQCLARHAGDLRETLFALYDIYEQRRPASGQNMTYGSL